MIWDFSQEFTRLEVVHCKNFIHRDIKRILPPSILRVKIIRGLGGSRTKNSRKFRISQFGTCKNGSCPLQEFHSPRYQANFATQYFLRQVPQRPWWPNDSSIYLRFKKFKKKTQKISLRILLIWNLFGHRLFFARIGLNTLTRE